MMSAPLCSQDDLNGISPQAIALLYECGAMQRPHGQRTLFDHLVGTYGLLKSWGNTNSVCLGGLFHSIYGTNAFKHSSLLGSQRTQLQALIGEDAEQLAWRFCNIDRPRAILDAIAKREPAPEWIPMAEIEVANLIEQDDIVASVRDLFCLGLEQPSIFSRGAMTALQMALSKRLKSRRLSAPMDIHLTTGARQ